MGGFQGDRGYWLLYDGDCRICRAFARWVRAFDVRRRLRIQPIQQSAQLLGAEDIGPILDAMHVVAPEGAVTTGGDALPTLLEAMSGAPPLGTLLRTSPSIMAALDAFYGVLVGLRGHLICHVDAARSPQAVLGPR